MFYSKVLFFVLQVESPQTFAVIKRIQDEQYQEAREEFYVEAGGIHVTTNCVLNTFNWY